MKAYIKIVFQILFITFLITCMFAYPQAVHAGVLSGMDLCVNKLVPSLFFFMIVSSIIIHSGVAKKLGKFLNPVTNFLFDLPGVVFPVVLMGLIGGYAIGAKTTKILFDEGKVTEKQAKKLAFFCFGGGPAFTITLVGTIILKNTSLGVLMFFSQAISSLILGIILKFLSKTDKFIETEKISKKNTSSFSEAIVFSCSDAIETMLNLCGLVIAFSAFLAIIENFAFSNVFLRLFLEVTSGCVEASNLKISPETILFALTFGGICVHFQVLSILKAKKGKKLEFSYLKFFVCRLFCGFLASGLLFFALKLFKNIVPVFLSTTNQVPINSFYNTASGSLTLIFLCLTFQWTITSSNFRKQSLKLPKCHPKPVR